MKIEHNPFGICTGHTYPVGGHAIDVNRIGQHIWVHRKHLRRCLHGSALFLYAERFQAKTSGHHGDNLFVLEAGQFLCLHGSMCGRLRC